MEKMIIALMKHLKDMTIEEMENEYEKMVKNKEPFRYLFHSVARNELNRRENKRHLSIEQAQRHYERMQAAE